MSWKIAFAISPKPWIEGTVIAAFALALASAPASAQEQEELEAEPVIVTATRTEEDISDVPASITVIEQDDIQLGRQTLGMSEPLRGVPGIFVQNQENFSGDLRMSIRGFGARGRFGIQGIKILVDGIPLTSPDGQTNVDSIDMGVMDRIEVLRGPSSALYGVAAGGVVSLTTEAPPVDPLIEGRITSGSFGFLKEQLKFGRSDGHGGGVIFNVTNMEYDGFREHSSTRARIIFGKIIHRLSETSELTLLFNHYDSPLAQDPQGLTKDQVKKDREQARPDGFFNGAVTQDTGEEVVDAQTALIYKKELEEDLLTLSYYKTLRKFTGRINPRVVEFDRDVTGGGIQYDLAGELMGRDNLLILGIDFQDQNDRRRNFGNESGAHGDLSLNQIEEATALGIFVNEKIAVTEQVGLSVGLRNDQIELSANDNFIGDGSDDSGSRTFSHTSYSLGVIYHAAAAANIYANVGQAFEVPTLTQLDNPSGGGGFNPDLDPQVANSIEVGVKGSHNASLTYDAAVFQIIATDEIVVFQDPDQGNIDFYRNAGETERTGFEAALRYRFSPMLALSFSYTQMTSEYTDFQTSEVDDGDLTVTDFSGNTIPGLPENQAYFEVAYNHPAGYYVIPEAIYVGEIQADDANSEKAGAYTVINLRTGFLTEFDNWPFSLFAGINNVTDEEYNQNIRVNDFGGRYFEPAPPMNIYIGISLGYLAAQ